MMKQLLFILLFFISSFSQAQVTFQKTYGGTGPGPDFGYSAQQTTDGGYIIAGYTTYNFSTSGYDIYLIKTDLNGDTLWTKTYGGIGDDIGNYVRQTSDGGYIITGRISQSGGGGYDVCLIKTNANGDSLWTKAFGTGLEEGFSVEQTNDGGFIVVGYYVGSIYVYLIKTDPNGDTLWTKTFGGSNMNDYGYSVQQTNDGGFIVTGITNVGSGFSTDVLLVKTDAIGNILWTKNFGGTRQDQGYSVRQTSDGGFIIAGSTKSFTVGTADAYLIRTDTSGNLLWSKTFGKINGDNYGFSVQQTNDGGFVLAGLTTGFNVYTYLIKTDSNGDTLWTNSGGGHSIEKTNDGGFVIAGGGASNNNAYLIKTDSNGNSFCNQPMSTIIVTTPATITGNPAIQFTSSTTIVSNPTIQVGSGGGVTTICYTGVNEIKLMNEINISPNPSSDFISVIYKSQTKNPQFEIIDITGRKILTTTRTQIDVSKLPQGLYLLKVTDGELQFSKRFVKD